MEKSVTFRHMRIFSSRDASEVTNAGISTSLKHVCAVGIRSLLSIRMRVNGGFRCLKPVAGGPACAVEKRKNLSRSAGVNFRSILQNQSAGEN